MFSLFRKSKKMDAKQKRKDLLRTLKDKGLAPYYEPFSDAIFVFNPPLVLLSDDFGFKSYAPNEAHIIRDGQRICHESFKRVHSLEELQAELEASQ